MKLTRRDGIATLLFAAILIPYVGYVIRGTMPFIQDPRGMASVGLFGLALALAAWGAETRFERTLFIVGIGVLGIGIAAAWIGVEGSEVLLAVFVGSIAAVWALETGYHAGLFTRSPHGRIHA